MKEIFVAKNEFAASLASSAVSKPVTKNGVPAASGPAYTCLRIPSAQRELTPAMILSGARVSATAEALTKELRIPRKLGPLACPREF